MFKVVSKYPNISKIFQSVISHISFPKYDSNINIFQMCISIIHFKTSISTLISKYKFQNNSQVSNTPNLNFI